MKLPIHIKIWCRIIIHVNRLLPMQSVILLQELKELEDTILGAEDKLYALEYELYSEVRDTIGQEVVVRIQNTAKAIAKLDVFASLALVAEQNNYADRRLTKVE